MRASSRTQAWRCQAWRAGVRAGCKVTSAEDESLHNLLANNLLKFKAELQELSDAASREHALEKQLDKMQADWVRFGWGLTSGALLAPFFVLC